MNFMFISPQSLFTFMGCLPCSYLILAKFLDKQFILLLPQVDIIFRLLPASCYAGLLPA